MREATKSAERYFRPWDCQRNVDSNVPMDIFTQLENVVKKAAEESKCNECHALIGGTRHNLRTDNSLAGEMDGDNKNTT